MPDGKPPRLRRYRRLYSFIASLIGANEISRVRVQTTVAARWRARVILFVQEHSLRRALCERILRWLRGRRKNGLSGHAQAIAHVLVGALRFAGGVCTCNAIKRFQVPTPGHIHLDDEPACRDSPRERSRPGRAPVNISLECRTLDPFDALSGDLAPLALPARAWPLGFFPSTG
jgi:hypothetical protein